MTDLEPCPFCGGEAHLFGDHEYRKHWVTCADMDCRGGKMLAVVFMSKRKAIAAWNTRAPSPAARERDAMREALTRLASSEAFDLPQNIDGPLAKEMRMRMDFARQALNQEKPA